MIYSCALIGDPGTGKTSFLKRHLTGEFVRMYSPTQIFRPYFLEFSTNYGDMLFNVWETSELTELADLRVKCAIVMADASRPRTFLEVPNFQCGICEHFGKIPVVVCENKVDLRPTSSKAWQFLMHENFEFFSISVKKSQNLGMPFLWMSRKLLHSPDLNFIPKTALKPPRISNFELDSLLTSDQFLNVLPPIWDDDW